MSNVVIKTGRNHTYGATTKMYIWACPECGIIYGVPQDYAEARRKDGGRYYCPNGDSLSFYETDREKALKEAEAMKRRAENAERAAATQRERAQAAERSASAYKGAATKIRNRIAAGVCPVPGCRRSGFSQVMRHIASKHPSWIAEHVHEIPASSEGR